MSIHSKKKALIILVLIFLLLFILYFLVKRNNDFTLDVLISGPIKKSIQDLSSQNLKCFSDMPQSQSCLCMGIGCCGPSTGFYYNSKTDLCYEITVENSTAPFKSRSECEETCQTMIYDRLGDKYIKIDKTIYYLPPEYDISIGGALEDVDIDTFSPVGSFFGKDVNSVYHNNHKIETANPKSFLELSADYGKDYRNIFYKTEIIEGVDYNSFEVLKNVPGLRTSYAKDKNNIYISGKIFSLADVDSFWVSDTYGLSKDKNYVYIFDKISDLDPDMIKQ
jgi:hypothetical protein